MNLPEIHQDFVIARHHHGVKLVAPESQLAAMMGIMSVADSMKAAVHFYFTDHTQIIREMNDVCAKNAGAVSKHDLVGYSIERISPCAMTNLRIEENNREVMRQRSLKVFDELTTLRSGSMLHTLSIKLPWYSEDNKMVGIFGCSIPVIKENMGDLPLLFAQAMNRFTLPDNQLLNTENGSAGQLFSARENEILRWVVRGKTMREISGLVGLSRRTVESYFENIKNKLGVKTRSQVVDLVIDYFI